MYVFFLNSSIQFVIMQNNYNFNNCFHAICFNLTPTDISQVYKIRLIMINKSFLLTLFVYYCLEHISNAGLCFFILI